MDVVFLIEWTWLNVLLILQVYFVIWGVLFPERLLSILKRHSGVVRATGKSSFFAEIFTDGIEYFLVINVSILPQHIS